MPVASVVWFAPVTVPPLVPGANVTATPATGLLRASRTITDGGMATAVPVVAFWPLPAFIAIWVAAPAVTFTVADVMGVNCWAEKPSVCGPAVPLIDRFVNRAAPLELVLMSTVPPSVPPPEAIDARTVMPNWLTGLPEASCSWMTGCWRKATPLCTVADGCVVIASFATGPAVAVAVNVTGLPVMPLPAAVAVSVFGPAVVPSVHEDTAAIPPGPVVTGVVGFTVPLPAAGANVTATLATGLLNWSWTITAGGVVTAVPTAADWLFPALTATDAAAPAVPVAVNVTGLPFSPVDVAGRVLVPAGLPSVQLPTVAMPLALVV